MAKLLRWLLPLALLLAPVVSVAQVSLPRSAMLNNAQPTILVDPSTGLPVGSAAAPLAVNATVSATASIAAFAPTNIFNGAGGFGSGITGTSSKFALTGAAVGSTALVTNTNATDTIYVLFCPTTTCTATALNGVAIGPGSSTAFNIGANTEIAGISSGSGPDVTNVSAGTGLPALAGGGSSGGGGGGAVTNAGTFAVQCTSGCPAPAASKAATNGSLAANLVVKASAGSLYTFTASADTTLDASTWYFMIFDAASVPADGTVTPAFCYAVPPPVTSGQPQTIGGTFTGGGISFSSGIAFAASTTGCGTKTSSTHLLFANGTFQ